MDLKIDPVAEQTILSLLRNGDLRHAARLLVRYHGVAVYRVSLDIVGDPSTAEDLTQASFARVFALLGGFGGELSSREWVVGIARRCAESHVGQDPADIEPGEPGETDDGISDSLRRRLEVLAAAV